MKIAEKLGLPADATDEQQGAAVDKLKSDASAAINLSESQKAATGTIGEIRTVLSLAENVSAKDIVSTVKTLSEKNTALEKEKREKSADDLLTAAVKDGKIAPAMKATYREQLLSENQGVVDAATKIIKESPKVIPIGDRTASGAEAPETDPEKLLDERIVELQKANPKLTYAKALVLAEEQLTAAAGGEK